MPNAISGLASAFAPIVFFHGVPFANIREGNALLTLTATRYMASPPDHTVLSNHVVVAHLRCSVSALVRLRVTIDNVLLHPSVPAPTAGGDDPGLPN